MLHARSGTDGEPEITTIPTHRERVIIRREIMKTLEHYGIVTTSQNLDDIRGRHRLLAQFYSYTGIIIRTGILGAASLIGYMLMQQFGVSP